MSDDKRGLSLRRKKTSAARPKISAPQQIPKKSAERWDAASQTSTSTTREQRPRLDGTMGDKTTDLVKRRYSTRFAGPQDFGYGGPAPAMPSMPPQFSRAPPSQESVSRDKNGRLKVDLRALDDSNLQAEKYVQGLLAEASADDIAAYQAELHNVKALASADLQHNVYQNRTQFIKIAKEADKLKSEMRTLQTLMGELTGTLGHATSAAGDITASSSAERKRANRSSVANLEAMWSTHLQVLWKRVEGSQKYLPALPGRHIILESQRWVELNAATWKPRRRVALVLLNDHLLVASEKKRTAQDGKSATTSFAADRCWPLSEVSLADLASTSGTPRSSVRGGSREQEIIKNAINIRAGAESFTYATSDTGEKLAFLVAFRKAQEDQRKRAAAEHGERERALDQMALITGRDARSLKKAADEIAGPHKSDTITIDVEGRQQSIRQVESQIDALDIDIALQRFEEAVVRVEKLRSLGRGIKGNPTAQEIILGKVNDRAAKLATAIARRLTQTSSGASATRDNVQSLLRLGFEDVARNRYLEARTESLRLHQRQLPFTGPLPPYLQALSFVTFTQMAHTFRVFSSSFPPASASAVVKWNRERLTDFIELVQRQVQGLPERGLLTNECQQAVLGEIGVLSDVGVDFRGIVLQGLKWEDRPSKTMASRPRGVIGLGVS